MSATWDLPDFDDHEAVHFFRDVDSGLRAIIAVHSTHLGPAAGGVRFWHYGDNGRAVTDALRLSRGMSYKNAMAGLPMGGGKAVIIACPRKDKSQDMMEAFGMETTTFFGVLIRVTKAVRSIMRPSVSEIRT